MVERSKYEQVGVSRKIGNRGRVTIPPVIREKLGMEEGTVVEFLAREDTEVVIIRKVSSSALKCVFCHAKTDKTIEDVPVCPECEDALFDESKIR